MVHIKFIRRETGGGRPISPWSQAIQTTAPDIISLRNKGKFIDRANWLYKLGYLFKVHDTKAETLQCILTPTQCHYHAKKLGHRKGRKYIMTKLSLEGSLQHLWDKHNPFIHALYVFCENT